MTTRMINIGSDFYAKIYLPKNCNTIIVRFYSVNVSPTDGMLIF
jgi:hypothetical protein